MSIVMTFLQFFGLIVLVAIVFGFVARKTYQVRSARLANRAARFGIDAPGRGADRDAGGRGGPGDPG
jgi:hypothetical protein